MNDIAQVIAVMNSYGPIDESTRRVNYVGRFEPMFTEQSGMVCGRSNLSRCVVVDIHRGIVGAYMNGCITAEPASNDILDDALAFVEGPLKS